MEYTDANPDDIEININTIRKLFKIFMFVLVIMAIPYIIQNIDTITTERFFRFIMVVLFTMIARSIYQKNWNITVSGWPIYKKESIRHKPRNHTLKWLFPTSSRSAQWSDWSSFSLGSSETSTLINRSTWFWSAFPCWTLNSRRPRWWSTCLWQRLFYNKSLLAE